MVFQCVGLYNNQDQSNIDKNRGKLNETNFFLVLCFFSNRVDSCVRIRFWWRQSSSARVVSVSCLQTKCSQRTARPKVSCAMLP